MPGPVHALRDGLGARWGTTAYWAGSAILLALALALTWWTVATPRVGAALTAGSLAMALTWVVAALWAGIEVRWWPRRMRDVGLTLALALGCAAAFSVGAVLFLRWGILEEELATLAGRAEETSLWVVWLVALVTGAAEEVYFRGTVYAWLRRTRPVLTSTLAYAAAVAATGQLALVVAAAGLGLAVGLARRFTDSLVAPIVVHGVWTTTMTFLLPALIHRLG